jgi:hypothetical protein
MGGEHYEVRFSDLVAVRVNLSISGHIALPVGNVNMKIGVGSRMGMDGKQ